jgi:hypothetical protein
MDEAQRHTRFGNYTDIVIIDIVVGKKKSSLAPFKALVEVNHERQKALFAVWSPIGTIMVKCKPLTWVIPIKSKTFIQSNSPPSPNCAGNICRYTLPKV